MKYLSIFLFLLILSINLASCSTAKNDNNKKPNIIYILADDLGYGELACYGQTKIETPNIDKLAQDGIRFTQHYSGAPVCAPARSVLMTGMHSGHTQIRGNDAWDKRGKVWDYHAMIADSTLEGQAPLSPNTQIIPKLLKKVGYATGMIGKWGLGAPHTESIPTKMGFDFFCGYNCQRQAHTYYPVHLYKNENRINLGNDTIAPGTKLPHEADPLALESYTNYNLQTYAPDVMFEEMISFLENNKKNPFFLYWASPIPHAPLQAPKRWVDYYVKKFCDEKPYNGKRGYFPHRYPHAAYAAMISYLDERIGQMIVKLKELGIYENTIIIFSSDNGPSYNGGTDSPWFNSAGPFKSERGWGKGFTYEGGIRIPMIASWKGRIKPGTETNHISAFWDVLPTLCEISGAKIPENIDGISFLPTLLDKKEQKQHDYLYWEFPEQNGQQALRMGDWKAIRHNIKKGNMEIKLFNLKEDIQEQNNVAAQNPELIKKIEQIFINEHTQPENKRFRMKQLGDSIKNTTKL